MSLSRSTIRLYFRLSRPPLTFMSSAAAPQGLRGGGHPPGGHGGGSRGGSGPKPGHKEFIIILAGQAAPQEGRSRASGQGGGGGKGGEGGGGPYAGGAACTGPGPGPRAPAPGAEGSREGWDDVGTGLT
jgi:hypothetical protein